LGRIGCRSLPALAAPCRPSAVTHRFFEGARQLAELRVARSRGSEAAQALGERSSPASLAWRTIDSVATAATCELRGVGRANAGFEFDAKLTSVFGIGSPKNLLRGDEKLLVELLKRVACTYRPEARLWQGQDSRDRAGLHRRGNWRANARSRIGRDVIENRLLSQSVSSPECFDDVHSGQRSPPQRSAYRCREQGSPSAPTRGSQQRRWLRPPPCTESARRIGRESPTHEGFQIAGEFTGPTAASVLTPGGILLAILALLAACALDKIRRTSL
jgi:hypothetical protein